jgi:hypothetical protein
MSLEEQYLPSEIWVSIFNIFDHDQKLSYPIFNLRLVCKEWANSIDNTKSLTGKIFLFRDKKEIENIPKNIISLQLSFEKHRCDSWASCFTLPFPNIINLSFIIYEDYRIGDCWSPKTSLYPEIIRKIYPNISDITIIYNIRECLSGNLVALVEAIFPKDANKISHLSIHSFRRFIYNIKGPKYCDLTWATIDSLTIEGCKDLKQTTFNLPGLKELNLSIPHGHEDEKIVADKFPNVKINNIITD